MVFRIWNACFWLLMSFYLTKKQNGLRKVDLFNEEKTKK